MTVEYLYYKGSRFKSSEIKSGMIAREKYIVGKQLLGIVKISWVNPLVAENFFKGHPLDDSLDQQDYILQQLVKANTLQE